MQLSPAIQKLVVHWGEMGARWGISRTVAQIHALLYFTGDPLNAEDMVAALGVARSHISNSLRQLQDWGIIHVVHKLGDRRDYFECVKDVWQMFEILLDERKRREVDPTLKALRETATQLTGGASETPQARQRIADMLAFFEVMDNWYSQVRHLPLSSRVRLVKLGSRLQKLLG